VPIGYGASAFALGVAAGTVVRRTVPAIAITLAVYVLVLVAVPTVRAHLAPATLTTRITQENVRGLSASFDVTGVSGSGRWSGSLITHDAHCRLRDDHVHS
jgi:hypothetical protein